jgi:predicted AAA+ superfamily ATPase
MMLMDNNKSLNGLAACRAFLEDPVLARIEALQNAPASELTAAQAAAASLLLQKAEDLPLTGNAVQAYLIYLLAEGNFPAAEAVEKAGRAGSSLQKAFASDLAILWPYLVEKPSTYMGTDLFDAYEPAGGSVPAYREKLQNVLLSQKNAEEAAGALINHYIHCGRGPLARYTAFRLDDEGHFIGIDPFPPFAWDDLIGYAAQKEKLLANAEAFLAGRPYNNVLLTGARGTGKSTSIKALVSRFSEEGLRLVQVTRTQLPLLQELMEKLGVLKSKKFIFFFDDLSFDENETEYKYLKSAMDGGVSPQPSNIMLCATSNRRHLLKETWKDRSDELDEVYRDDSTNESISLSDRFGLHLYYSTPTQDEYLAMIDNELKKAGITLPPETLRIEGVRWEMEHSGRNGRIAHQFVRWYLGRK